MKNFIYRNDLITIKRKLYLLYFLNVSDILLTYVLLRTGFFEEINILLKPIINDVTTTILLKVVFVLILIFVICKRLVSATSRQLKICNRIIIGIITVYILINLSHLFWLVRIFSM